MITSYDIDLNARSEFGRTGIVVVCSYGHTEIVRLMIENQTEYGIHIQQEDDDGDNALDLVKKVWEQKRESIFRKSKTYPGKSLFRRQVNPTYNLKKFRTLDEKSLIKNYETL